MTALVELTTDELLTTTRSIKKRFDFDRPVPLELVYECLELALQAPNSENRQEWDFLIITDKEKKTRLGRLTLGDVVTDEDNFLGRVPLLVVSCITNGIRDDGRSRFSIPQPMYGSILPAAWSFCLAARSRGLGTRWTTHAFVKLEEAKEILGIPNNVTPAVIIPVAYTTGSAFGPGPRRPLTDVIHLNDW